MFYGKSKAYIESFNTRVVVEKQLDHHFSITIVRVCIPLFLASELFGVLPLVICFAVFRECMDFACRHDAVEWKRPLSLIIPLLPR